MTKNSEQMEANIAKIQRDTTIQGVKEAIAILALVAAAFALGYYIG